MVHDTVGVLCACARNGRPTLIMVDSAALGRGHRECHERPLTNRFARWRQVVFVVFRVEVRDEFDLRVRRLLLYFSLALASHDLPSQGAQLRGAVVFEWPLVLILLGPVQRRLSIQLSKSPAVPRRFTCVVEHTGECVTGEVGRSVSEGDRLAA